MTRIIIMSGKGGVGKTTMAAATGLCLAQRGYRTVVLSFDLAHSLSDSFNVHEELFSAAKGEPVNVAENLDIQEIDVHEELEKHWSDVYRYMAMLMAGSGGIDGVVAEEAAVTPGIEDVIALLYINDYYNQKTYDVVVVDSPPTTDSLRFVSITGTIDWYVRKRVKMDRRMANLMRPIAKTVGVDQSMLPDDGYFVALQRLFERLQGVDKLLHDPNITTVRLVTTPDRMVVRETQRAYMYFCLYNMAIDQIFVNRMLPDDNEYFGAWAKQQRKYTADIASWFDPAPITTVPYLQQEVVGLDPLKIVAEGLYPDRDPIEVFVNHPPYVFEKKAEGSYSLTVDLPFVSKDMIDLSRNGEDLIVRIGSFKRMIVLPRAIVSLPTKGARIDQSKLVVQFEKET